MPRGPQPDTMPTFVIIDGVGHEVMHIGEEGVSGLVEDLGGRLHPIDPRQLLKVQQSAETSLAELITLYGGAA